MDSAATTASTAGTLKVVCPHCETTNRVERTRLEQEPTCGNCKQSLFPRKPFALTAANFDRHVAGEVPLIVDCWASWCGPCLAMAPVYDEAAARLKPGIHSAKLDTDAEQAIAARLGIRGIPTLIVFRKGKEIARQSGAIGLPQLLQWIGTHASAF
jgi:thioredoxin 2